VQLQFSSRELAIKLVYYGPGLSGKTTNLAMLHERLHADHRSRLVTLETADERTLFFDMLPLQIGGKDADFMMRIKVFTVPGQPIHASARRLVLGGADGVAFIADSRVSQIENNAQSFSELRENLQANRLNVADLPLVIQFNKRDLPKVRSDEELHRMAACGREPVFPAVAARGDGVVETFMALFQATWSVLEERHKLGERMNIGAEAAIGELSKQLGVDVPVDRLLSTRYGGRGQGAQKGPRPQ
jgi:signal recognition particle receptor subunit beta